MRLRRAQLEPGGLPVLTVPQPASPDGTFELLGELPGRPHRPRPTHVLPYATQSRYGRDLVEDDVPVAVLENDHLRATFLLDLGGRLWSLVDKRTGADLLFQPDAVQLGNLALRDAWFSGGVEWNLGITGHWGLTCEPVSAGAVGDVLRLWAFERHTRLTWRLEATLDDDRLLVGVRLANHNPEAVPLYWWSNAAVPFEQADIRVAADHAWWHGYDGRLRYRDWPVEAPEREQAASDYFFDIAEPYEASLAPDGHGLLQASTPELRGRKLFVWGEGAGGRRWQRWLNGTGKYVEVQAGHSRTQHEHVALAPGERVSWGESYSSVTLGPGERPVLAPLPDPFTPVAGVAPDAWRAADPWGALEVAAGHLPDDPATPFGDLPDDHPAAAWARFAASGVLDQAVADDPVTGRAWLERLSSADESWAQQLVLGYALWADERRGEAVTAWQRSVELRPSWQALWALGASSDDGWDRFDHTERAWQLNPTHPELTVAYLAVARHIPTLVLRIVRALDESVRHHPRVRLAECAALLETGDIAAAEAILTEPLVIANLREGEDELTQLWRRWQQVTGRLDPLPEVYDFRMH